MALPHFNMRQLLEAGVHFGHQTHRWNPKMAPYIYGARNRIHIIDLSKTVPLLHQALVAVSDTIAQGGRLLFVGTKRQASDAIAEAAKRCAQYYINHRWLGGTLTNWKTISHSIRRLRKLESLLAGEAQGLTKKELLHLTRERDKLERALGGIKDMGGLPDLLFVIDTNKEAIAVAEARKLKIPVIAILDTNSDPDGIDYPVPGNDDAGRAINLYCDLIARAAIDGIERSQIAAGADIGASETVPTEAELPADAGAAEAEGGDGAAEESAEAESGETASEEPSDTEETETQAGSDSEGAATAPKFLDAPQGEPDDLKKISGVGPVLEKKLNAMGIFHYWQIAQFTPEDIAKVDEALSFKGRIERDGWVEQAARLAKGETAEAESGEAAS